MVYRYSFTITDEDGNPIVEREITADQAVDLLLKTAAPLQKVDAVEQVAPTPAPVEEKTEKNQNKNKYTGDRKSREAEVMKMIESGVKAADVAKELGISVQTVHNIKFRVTHGKPATGGVREKKPADPHPSMAAPVARALSSEEYADLRAAMESRDFMSARYALTNRLSPREVNKAVRSSDYAEYVDMID